MPVIIGNVGECPDGSHQYRVRINDTHICMFTHRREDKLAVCLLKAADAVATGVPGERTEAYRQLRYPRDLLNPIGILRSLTFCATEEEYREAQARAARFLDMYRDALAADQQAIKKSPGRARSTKGSSKKQAASSPPSRRGRPRKKKTEK